MTKALSTFVLLPGLLSGTTLCAQAPIVRVGPDILVSREPDVPHAELRVAAHPTDPKRLIGTAISFRSTSNVGSIIATYMSRDGGNTWTGSIHPNQIAGGGGEPHAGYPKRGTRPGLSI